MLRHIVAWNFIDDLSDEEKSLYAQKIKSDLEALKPIISQVVDLQVIINPERNTNRDLLLTSLFKTQGDLDFYRVHAEHQKVSKFVSSVTKDRVCLDFMED